VVFPDLPPGRYVVRLLGFEESRAETVEVHPGARTDVRLDHSPAASLTSQLVQADGAERRLDDVECIVGGLGTGFGEAEKMRARTDASGRWSFEAIPPGQYAIVVMGELRLFRRALVAGETLLEMDVDAAP